eukprot:4156353-Pleurochrysis_carterae.AAC.1
MPAAVSKPAQSCVLRCAELVVVKWPPERRLHRRAQPLGTVDAERRQQASLARKVKVEVGAVDTDHAGVGFVKRERQRRRQGTARVGPGARRGNLKLLPSNLVRVVAEKKTHLEKPLGYGRLTIFGFGAMQYLDISARVRRDRRQLHLSAAHGGAVLEQPPHARVPF